MTEDEPKELSEEEQIALCEKVEQEALEEMTRAYINRSQAFGHQAAWVLLVGLLVLLVWQTFWW